MTLNQICKHWRTGAAVKVDGRDAQITEIYEPAGKVVVEFADGSSKVVRFYDVKHAD